MTTIIKEFRWCKEYNIDCVTCHIGQNTVCIIDSFKIKKIKHMLEVLRWIKNDVKYNIPKLPSVGLMLCEWRAHNLLHKLKYETDRTRSVDLNNDNKWYITLGYIGLSLFYW